MDSDSNKNIWLYFEDVGDSVAKCKVCQKTYPFRTESAMSALKTHLLRIHDIPPVTTTKTPHQLFVTSTTLTTDDLLNYSPANIKGQIQLSENSDTDTQNNSQTANNTESSDIEQVPGEIVSLLDEAAKDKSQTGRTRSSRRRMKRPSLRGSIRINTDEDFGRLISKKMQMLPFAIRCRMEVDILRLVNGALHTIEEL